MKVKASELRPGQVVEIEYGASDNWRQFTIDKVAPFEWMVTVLCHSKDLSTDFSCRPEELVGVLDER